MNGRGRQTVALFFIVLMAGTLAVATLVAAGKRQQLLSEAMVKKAMNSPVKRVRRISVAKLPPNQIAIKVNDHRLKLNPADVKNYQSLTRNDVKAIEYVTHMCAGDVAMINKLVDKQRLARLFEFQPSLFTDKKIKWTRVYQTGCKFEYQALKWFHGFILTLKYAPGQGTANFIAERLRKDQENEYKIGDITNEVKAKQKSLKQPGTKYRPGHVYSTKKMPLFRKTKDGWVLTFPTKSPIPLPVLCDKDLLVSGGFNSKEYYSVKPGTGKVNWGKHLSDDGPSTGACAGGIVVFNTESCTIFALRTRDGSLVWSYWLGDPLMSTPAVAGGKVFTTYPGHSGDIQYSHLFGAFDLKTGRILWQKWIDSDAMHEPLTAGGKIELVTLSGIRYNFSTSGTLQKAERARLTSLPQSFAGNELAFRRYDKKTDKIAAEALTVGGRAVSVLPGAYLDSDTQIDSAYAKSAMKYDAQNGFLSGPPRAAHAETPYVHLGLKSVSSVQFYDAKKLVTVGNRLIVVHADTVAAYSASNLKKPLWKTKVKSDKKLGGNPVSSPTVAAGHVYISTPAGKVYALFLPDGSLKKTYDVGGEVRTKPMVHNGRLFVTTQTGQLHSMGL